MIDTKKFTIQFNFLNESEEHKLAAFLPQEAFTQTREKMFRSQIFSSQVLHSREFMFTIFCALLCRLT